MLEENSQWFRLLVCNFFTEHYQSRCWSTCTCSWENLNCFPYRFQSIKLVILVVPSPCETEPYTNTCTTLNCTWSISSYCWSIRNIARAKHPPNILFPTPPLTYWMLPRLERQNTMKKWKCIKFYAKLVKASTCT